MPEPSTPPCFETYQTLLRCTQVADCAVWRTRLLACLDRYVEIRSVGQGDKKPETWKEKP